MSASRRLTLGRTAKSQSAADALRNNGVDTFQKQRLERADRAARNRLETHADKSPSWWQGFRQAQNQSGTWYQPDTTTDNTFNASSFPGGEFSFPAYEQAAIQIPEFSTPSLPPLKRISYNDLLAQVETDPILAAEIADIDKAERNALADIAAQESLQTGKANRSKSKLDRQEEISRQQNFLDVASRGLAHSSIMTGRLGDVTEEYGIKRNDITEALNEFLQQLEVNRNTVRSTATTSRSNAKQNAVNRRIGARANVEEVVY